MPVPVFSILTHRRLERYRVFIPYPLVTGLLTFVFAIPFVFVGILARPQDWRVLIGIWIVAGLMLGGLMALVAAVGWLSGYRPFYACWDISGPSSRIQLAGRLKAEAVKLGADIMWEGAGGDFVGVIGMEREGESATHSGTEAPVRISLFLTPDKAVFRVTGRTVVIWDTGERERNASIAQTMIQNAGVSSLVSPYQG
jgi:hypothetical protein